MFEAKCAKKTAIGILAAIFVSASFCVVAEPAYATSGVERAANRLSKDRWAKTEPTAHHNSDSDDDDGDGSDTSPPPKGPHEGELNGHLHVKNW